MTTFFFRLIHCQIQNLCFGRVTVRFWWTSCKVVVTNCPSDNVGIQTIQHALWVPVKVWSSTAFFFLLIYHWQLMTCWIFKVLHLFCKMLWSICFEVQYWSTLSRKIILFEFFSEYFKFDQHLHFRKVS